MYQSLTCFNGILQVVIAVENRKNIGMVMLSFIEIMTREDREMLLRCGLLKVTRTPQYTSYQ